MTVLEAVMSDPGRGRKRSDAVILIAVLFIFAVVFGGFGLVKLRLGVASVSWPTTDGTVVASRLESRRSGDTTKYQPSVRYSYTVNGTRFDGRQITPVSSSTSRGKAEAVLVRYPSGKTVPVHYDPADPSRSVLEPGLSTSVFLILAAAAACLLGSLAIAVSAFKRG